MTSRPFSCPATFITFTSVVPAHADRAPHRAAEDGAASGQVAALVMLDDAPGARLHAGK